MARKRPPSGLPSDRIGGALLGGLESQIDGDVGFQPAGVRRVRNVFIGLTVAIGILVLVVLAAGNTDAAVGMTMALLTPIAIFMLISQLLLWYAESPR